MKVAFLGDGRDWSYHVASGLARQLDRKWKLEMIVTTSDKLFPQGPMEQLGVKTLVVDHKELKRLYQERTFDDVDVMLFYGWSWIVPKDIVDNKLCICLHPSPLPKYRGGSPIQHQIINGEKESAVSLFRMTEGLDAGAIFRQRAFPLSGHLRDVLGRIADLGLELTLEMLDGLAAGTLKPVEQDVSKVTSFKRRSKPESELTEEKLGNMGAERMFNFIRALEDPYPNAFIRLVDGAALLKRVDVSFPTDARKIVLATKLRQFTREEFSGLLKSGLSIRCADGIHLSIEEAAVTEQAPA